MFNLIYCIGIYALSCWLYDVFRSPIKIIYYTLLCDNAKRIDIKAKYGAWAAITGSTDGIGKAYAKELAKRGINTVLISRSEAKLKAVAEEIEDEFRVQTKIIVADFSQGEIIYSHIEKELNSIPVSILVNNVGQATSRPDFLTSFDAKDIWSILCTNIGAVTQLSRYFLQRMQAEGKKSIIVNISSVTEMNPLPYGAVYGATKAYTRSLTLALQQEARSTNTDIQLVSPNFVSTKINSYSKFIMRGNLFIPNAENYARWAVNRIGQVDETTGYFWHGIASAIFKIIPERVRVLIFFKAADFVVDDFEQLRKTNNNKMH